MTTTQQTTKRSLSEPDEVVEMPKGRLEIVKIGEAVFGRAVFEPGWRWSEHVKPVAKTASCEFPHALYVTSGALHVQMDDGTELDLVAGDVAVIAPGHDAWVVGDEPVIGYDHGAAEDDDWGKPAP
jgi:hypothetical protein